MEEEEEKTGREAWRGGREGKGEEKGDEVEERYG